MWDNIMIDVESFDLNDNALLLQIAIVPFTKEFRILKDESLNLFLNPVDGLLNGFDTSKDTLDFWNKQKSDVKENVCFNKNQVLYEAGAKQLNDYLMKTKNETKVYCNHLLFDIPKINNFLTKFKYPNIQSRFKYNSFEDYASIRNLTQYLYMSEFERESKLIDAMHSHHDGLSDCEYQIKILDLCDLILQKRLNKIL